MRKSSLLVFFAAVLLHFPSHSFEIFGRFVVGPRSGTIIVPASGTAIANGTDLLNAVGFVTVQSPSDLNRWEIKLEPGVYDIADNSLIMPDYVSLSGAGARASEIRSQTARTMTPCSHCQISNLAVSNAPTGSPGDFDVIEGSKVTELTISNVTAIMDSTIAGDESNAIHISDSNSINLLNVTARCAIDASDGTSQSVNFTSVDGLAVHQLTSIASGTDNVLTEALYLQDITNAKLTDLTLTANSEIQKAAGLVSGSNTSFSGVLMNADIQASSGSGTVMGMELEDVASVEFQNFHIEAVSSGLARGVSVINDSFSGQDVRFLGSRIDATGGDAQGILLKQNVASDSGFDIYNTSVNASCSDGGLCHSGQFEGEDSSDVRINLDIANSKFLSEADSDSLTSAEGLRLESALAEISNTTIIAETDRTLLVDEGTPSTQSEILYANGFLDANAASYVRANGTANVLIFSSTLEGTASIVGSAIVACEGNVINGTFASTGC